MEVWLGQWAGPAYKGGHKLLLHDEDTDYYLTPSKSPDNGLDVVTNRSIESPVFATLHACAGTFYLEAHVSSVSIEPFSWTDHTTSKSCSRLEPSNLSHCTWIQLRPEETFWIADTALRLQFMATRNRSRQEGEVQVHSSHVCDASENDQSHSQSISGPITDDLRPSTSTPARRSQTAIMETPVTNRRITFPKPDSIVTALAGQAMRGSIDSQNWNPSPIKQETMSIMREHAMANQAPNHFGAANILTSLISKTKDDNGVVDLENEGVNHNDDSSNDDIHQDENRIGKGRPTRQQQCVNEGEEQNDGLRITQPVDSPSPLVSADEECQDSISSLAANLLGQAIDSQSTQQTHSTTMSKVPTERDPHQTSCTISSNPQEDTMDAGKSLGIKPSKHFQSPHERPKSPLSRKRQKRVTAAESVNITKKEIKHRVKGNIRVEIPSASQTPASSRSSSKQLPQATPVSSSFDTIRRSTTRETASSTPSQKSYINVLFASSTSVDDSPALTSFLAKQKVRSVRSVKDCQVLCVGKGELKRTSNLILAILAGKDVVRDTWIWQSAKVGRLLDCSAFLAEDLEQEHEWGTTLAEAVQRGREGVRPLQGWWFNITRTARKELGKGFDDIKEIAVTAGAERVQNTIPRKSPDQAPRTVVIASATDTDMHTLQERGWKVFTKELIIMSILRGALDVDSAEFMIQQGTEGGIGITKKRKR
ncbi:MAG: hypothetical protein Q9214_004557 [Letrouitia sp. 1 TL-2023]